MKYLSLFLVFITLSACLTISNISAIWTESTQAKTSKPTPTFTLTRNTPAAPIPTDILQPTDTPSFNLQGIWQRNGFMAAGWADRYHFYPSGSFHFYPNQMTCSKEKIEKIGTWKYENNILTLTTTKQVINSLEVYQSGLCHIIDKKEVKLTDPIVEQFTIVDHGTQEGDIYPSISINNQQFWKFSDDASSYGDEKFPEEN